ncbi:MAG TPA: secondary thiamine-phosphate synthase enzyme YjbQ [Myxococcota bacterium]|nr:secondary thiamine-phosphate synthase enzyme YjbQ [Myxococcota bacterium]HRY92446.1 secondary thiamine-phosphate synthase enzyme YjbQ [Myxococcota bacterium]HSA23371.1 secondary thiamine-phosphate synthase enzyme YjbQ [Myxococcota bacterium]
MLACTRSFELETDGRSEVVNVTAEVRRIVEAEGLGEGLATVWVPGATASVTTLEFEPGAVADLRAAVGRLAPEGEAYQHDRSRGDGNGYSHVRAGLLGPSLAVPVTGGALLLGSWQQIVVVDHDNHPRKRVIAVQLLGN